MADAMSHTGCGNNVVLWVSDEGGVLPPKDHATLVAAGRGADWRPLVYGDTAQAPDAASRADFWMAEYAKERTRTEELIDLLQACVDNRSGLEHEKELLAKVKAAIKSPLCSTCNKPLRAPRPIDACACCRLIMRSTDKTSL